MKQLSNGEDPVDHGRDHLTGEPFDKFDNQIFRDGFLHKKMSIRNLFVDGVIPTFEELQKFQGPSSKRIDDDYEDMTSRDRGQKAQIEQARQISALQQQRMYTVFSTFPKPFR